MNGYKKQLIIIQHGQKKYARSKGENAIHGSDSDENAEIEISFHFDNEEIFS